MGYVGRHLPLLRQFLLMPNRINEFVDHRVNFSTSVVINSSVI
jgi:hypothetical protein